MVALVLALSLFGIIMVFSASYYTSLSKFGNAYEYLKQDAMWVAVGWVAFLFFANMDYHFLKLAAWPALGVGLVLLCLIFTPLGVTLNNATRWLDFGFATVMPGEIIKFALIIWIATFLGDDPEKIRRLKDENGLCPATIEEMLEAARGKELLFIELKGATADTQMVDDLVKIIREMGMTEEAALISLEYPVIDYAETNYPEFLTGTLFFAGSGDVSKLNCDLLIMEEEAASYQRVDRIHDAGKQAIVWTVNTESGMRRFLSSEIDAVITDELPLAERIREELNDRDELTVMRDRFADAWD